MSRCRPSGSALVSLIRLRDGRVLPMDSSEFRAYLRSQDRPPLSARQKALLWPLLAPMREALRRRAEQRLAEMSETGDQKA
jgi:hypothetical protein